MPRKYIPLAALVLLLTVFVYAVYALDFTKADASVDVWTALAAATSAESTNISLTDDVGTIVHVDLASTSTNAVTAGSQCKVIVWTKSGATDEFWHVLTQMSHSGATAVTQALNATSGAGQANPDRIEVAATANFNVPGSIYFLKDNTLANSEIVCCKVAVTNDYVQVMDAMVREHDASDALFNLVSQWSVRIPAEVSAIRVTFHTADDNATYAYRVRTSKITDIE